MAQDHFWTPPDPKRVAPGMLQAVCPNVCLGPVRHIYNSMHVVILTLMLQQSQMQGVQRLHL